MNDHTHKHTHGKRDAASSVERPVATNAAAAIDGTPGLAGTAVTYTCPMHPEVRQDHPGRCPKCQMHLVPEGQVAHGDHRHHDHHAHAARESAPVAPAAAPQEAPAGTTYTCPMHPEVRQDHPGNCPKCGMTLEPIIPLDEEDNSELKDFQRRFWWTLPLTVIVTVLAMWGHRLGLFSMATQTWVELLLSLPVVLWTGWPFFVRGWQSIVHRSPNMWTLIGLGTAAAFVYSVVATVTPGVFPESFVAMGRVAVYFEAAVVIISLTMLGQIIELKARSQTSAAIKSLLGLAPKTARRINADGSEEDVPLNQSPTAHREAETAKAHRG